MNFQDFKKEQMKKPEFKKEYDSLETEFKIKQALIDLRKTNNLSQKELSELTGIAQGDISKLENGKGNPTLEILNRIAKAMNAEVKIEFVRHAV